MESNYLINIKTGEALDIDVSDEKLSDAYRAVKAELNRLKRIEDALSTAILDRVPKGEKKFANYWTVIESSRVSYHYPDESTKKRIKLAINEMQRPFARTVKFTFLKQPKY
jgi:hypothetical protein